MQKCTYTDILIESIPFVYRFNIYLFVCSTCTYTCLYPVFYRPLTITCWVELLMHDVYTMATHRLGFREPKLSTDAMVEELDHTLRSSIDSSLSMSLSLPQRNSNRLDRLSLSDTLRSSSSGATLTSRSLLSTSSRLVNRLRHQMFFQAEQSVEIIQGMHVGFIYFALD
jgi:hypothetical protein